MPNHMPKEEEFGYRWTGSRLGNTHTCTAQGFFVTFGLTTTFAYNGSLCVYYACTIALAMKERNVKTYVEPILHVWAVAIGLLSSILPLFYDLYNPATSTFAWCAGLPYPEECAYEKSIECLRGNAEAMGVLRQGLVVLIMFDFSLIAVTMIMVIVKAIKTNQFVEMVYKRLQARHDSAAWHQEVNFRHHLVTRQSNVKATIIHASSYIIAFLIVLLIPLLIASDTFEDPIDMNESELESRFQVDKAMLVLVPLQGFFNFFIFISLKIYNYRQTHNEARMFQAFIKVIKEPIQEPCYISRISIVNHDRNDVVVQDIDNGNGGGVDINLTHDKHAEQGNSVATGAANKVFVLSMSDESGTSNLLYRIKLFKADIQQQASNSLYFDKKESSSKVRDGHEYDDIDVEQETNSDDYSSIPRISYSMKSDSTINADEQRKKYIDNLFSNAFNRHQSKQSNCVNERNYRQSAGSKELIDHQSIFFTNTSLPTDSLNEKLDRAFNAEEQTKNEINRQVTLQQQSTGSECIFTGSIDSDIEFNENSDFDSNLSYSLPSDITTNVK
jgi:hypothetical protein